jgi:hypothetical protein
MSYTKDNHESEKDQIIYEFLQSALLHALLQQSPGVGVAVGLNTANDGMKYFNLQVNELSGPPTSNTGLVNISRDRDSGRSEYAYEPNVNPPMEFSFS